MREKSSYNIYDNIDDNGREFMKIKFILLINIMSGCNGRSIEIIKADVKSMPKIGLCFYKYKKYIHILIKFNVNKYNNNALHLNAGLFIVLNVCFYCAVYLNVCYNAIIVELNINRRI